jgi:hypothetical protein
MCVVNFMPLSLYYPRRNFLPPVPGTRPTRGWVPPGGVWTLWRKQNLDPCLEPNCDTLVVQTIAWALTSYGVYPPTKSSWVHSDAQRRWTLPRLGSSLHVRVCVHTSWVEPSFAESKVLTPHVFIVVSLTSVIGQNGCCFALKNECYNVDYIS